MKILAILFLLTSCANGYQQQTRFNVNQCVHMCASGNVIGVEQFGCTCNTQRQNSSTQSRAISSSNGNTTVIYNTPPQQQNSPNLMNAIMGVGKMWIDGENEFRRSLNTGSQQVPTQPMTNQDYIYVPQQTDWSNN